MMPKHCYPHRHHHSPCHMSKWRPSNDAKATSSVPLPSLLPTRKQATERQRCPGTIIHTSAASVLARLGWEFQFLVPISGNPIGSRIPIPFSIPKIPVGIFFSNSAVEKLRNRKSDSKIRNSEKK
jgi:hypothetical protein